MNSHSDYSDDDSLDLYKIRSELNLDDEVDEAYDLFRRINKQYNLEVMELYFLVICSDVNFLFILIGK